MQREKFSSRLGFILISAGCAIGLGNVWRFPYIVGKYGGATFVLIYLAFLLILGLPIMVMEFSVGRASKVSAALSFDRLEPKGTKWHWYKYGAMAGNYLLMMFYTTIAGWMVQYFIKMMTGEFEGKDTAAVAGVFSDMLAKPGTMTFFMIIVVVGCFAICGMGLQNGVEKITKVMMSLLLALMLILAVRSVTLNGASEGLRFYLAPDFHKVVEYGLFDTIFLCYGTGFLHIKPWNRRNCYFRKLYRQIPQSYRRSSPGNTSGYLCCFDRGSDHFPVMLRIWGGSGRRSESDLYHTSECI